MDSFMNRHRGDITSSLSCFDRVVFKGYLPLCRLDVMESFLSGKGILLKHLQPFVEEQTEQIKEYAQQMAKREHRPYLFLRGKTRKESIIDEILKDQPLPKDSGLIAVLSTVETCSSFRMVHAEGRPRLKKDRRMGLCLYFYFQSGKLGRVGIRLQTWFPFSIQVCVNGHDVLERSMIREGLSFEKEDNCFVRIDNPEQTQRLANRFPNLPWPKTLSRMARHVNPLLSSILKGMQYYWVVDQAEMSTDILFSHSQTLASLYPRLLRHATLSFAAEDIMTFLGKKPSARFAGDVKSFAMKRLPGARIKHIVKGNWIKMYNKSPRVLRIETVINHPQEFKVRRKGTVKGRETIGWFPMPKGIGYLWRWKDVMIGANRRYLDALAHIENPEKAYRLMEKTCEPIVRNKRHYRGLNPLNPRDLLLFLAVMRGEHSIHGLRNRDIARHLGLPCVRSTKERSRQSAHVTRKLKLLHAHGFIAKIPRSRRWHITTKGASFMAAAIHYRESVLPDSLMRPA